MKIRSGIMIVWKVKKPGLIPNGNMLKSIKVKRDPIELKTILIYGISWRILS